MFEINCYRTPFQVTTSLIQISIALMMSVMPVNCYLIPEQHRCQIINIFYCMDETRTTHLVGKLPFLTSDVLQRLSLTTPRVRLAGFCTCLYRLTAFTLSVERWTGKLAPTHCSSNASVTGVESSSSQIQPTTSSWSAGTETQTSCLPASQQQNMQHR